MNTRLLLWLAVFAAVLAQPASAMEPEQREATVISARVWEGHDYREIFVPSNAPALSVVAGNDSVVAFVRTLEYYWPLSRQVYVDFQSQRDLVEGEVVIRRNGTEIDRQELQPFSIYYSEGASRGRAEILWGEQAGRAYAEQQEAERNFAREFAAARRAHTAYERRLVEAGRNRQEGEEPEAIDPPPPLPQASLRLVTPPQPGFRIALDAGEYRISLERQGETVPGTERNLLVIPPPQSRVLVMDVVPAERWTRPLASHTEGSRIYARPGATFYLTLAEADRFAEQDYLSVVQPQSEPVAQRTVWIRREPATVQSIAIGWGPGDVQRLAREALKVEQTRGTGFGYRIRAARQDEAPDLNAFVISTPDEPAVRRGLIGGTDGADLPLSREIVVVHPRNHVLTLILATIPLGAFFALKGLARRRNDMSMRHCR